MAGIHDDTRPHPFPELHGHGLRLTSWDPDSDAHVEDWFRGLTDPDFVRWNTPLVPVETRDDARRSLRSKAAQAAKGVDLTFRVTDAADGTALGVVSLSAIDHVFRTARVGYWVLPEARGRGVATRSLTVAARWGLTELGLYRLDLGHGIGHDASCRIAERCGFRYEGTLRGAMPAPGSPEPFKDAHLHGRIASDPEPAAP
ncbi:GNAT family N-acetyltransferase [Streptomyces sp. NPDC052051]|uniref:GNAT family N-acetyltransferase n=1 Tax=Streptomyces sp. NPDC052051 TaxID=3154649 RepID=UPI00343429F7